MTQRRLRQANLFGPAGFVSADDGEVIELSQKGFEQKPFHRTLAELGGREVGDTDHMVTETLIRGMYEYWRKHDGGLNAWTSEDYFELTAALRRLRQRRRRRATGSGGPSSSPRTCSYRLQPRENFERGFPLATLVVREQGHAEGPRLRHPRDAVPRSVLPAPRRRRAARAARSKATHSRAKPTTRCSAPSSSEPTTVFNVGRYIDTVVRTPEGLTLRVAAARVRQRDDPELDHLSDLMTPMNPEWTDVAGVDDLFEGDVIEVQSPASRSRCTASTARSMPPTTSARTARARCARAGSKASRSNARCTRAGSTCATGARCAPRRPRRSASIPRRSKPVACCSISAEGGDFLLRGKKKIFFFGGGGGGGGGGFFFFLLKSSNLLAARASAGRELAVHLLRDAHQLGPLDGARQGIAEAAVDPVEDIHAPALPKRKAVSRPVGCGASCVTYSVRRCPAESWYMNCATGPLSPGKSRPPSSA